MAITVSNIQDNLNTYLGDSSTDRISAAERLQSITEATVWLQEELGNDHQNVTYDLDFLDTIFYYKITTAVPDLMGSVDLRRAIPDHDRSFTYKSARELAEEIGQGETESSFSIEYRDTNWYLAVNHGSSKSSKVILSADATDNGGGTWAVDSSNSDATNLTIDTVEIKEGTGSFNFDADVSQSVNDRATIQNTTLNKLDLTTYEDLGSWLMEVYIPDVTNFTGITLFWGDDTSNFWSVSATTDIDGSAWANGWNTVKVNWSDSTKTLSPVVTAIDFIRIDFDYTNSQTDDTDFRIDYLRIANPEKLTFHYTTWNVGTNTSGTDITVFGNTSDIPFFSGQYDQYKYAVAHKAASMLFDHPLRLFDDARIEDARAEEQIGKVKNIFPRSQTPEVKSFKVAGIRFRKRR